MLAIGRALMAQPRLLLLDEPSLGLAPQIVERIGQTIVEINAQGTAVVLVEQNAAMALKVADRAVRARGRPGRARTGPPPSWPRSDEVRARYLGIAAEADVERVTATPVRPDAADVREPQALEVRDVTVRFGGLAALGRRLARRSGPGRRTRSSAPTAPASRPC